MKLIFRQFELIVKEYLPIAGGNHYIEVAAKYLYRGNYKKL